MYIYMYICLHTYIYIYIYIYEDSCHFRACRVRRENSRRLAKIGPARKSFRRHGSGTFAEVLLIIVATKSNSY